MDFVQFMNEQRSKLARPNLYFDELWKDIIHETGAEEAPDEHRAAFEHHLPFDMPGFYESCQKKLSEALNGGTNVDFSKDNLDRSYPCVLVYSTMNQMSQADKLVPLSAARLYLMLCCLPGHGCSGFFHRTIFRAVLNTLDYYLALEEAKVKVHEVLVWLRRFLMKQSLSENLIVETTAVLSKVISSDHDRSLHNFCMDSPTVSAPHTSLLCIKCILNKLDLEVESQKKVILHILFNLTCNLSSSQLRSKNRESIEVLHSNLRNFLKDVMDTYTKDGVSLLTLVIKTLAVQPHFDFYDVSR